MALCSGQFATQQIPENDQFPGKGEEAAQPADTPDTQILTRVAEEEEDEAKAESVIAAGVSILDSDDDDDKGIKEWNPTRFSL